MSGKVHCNNLFKLLFFEHLIHLYDSSFKKYIPIFRHPVSSSRGNQDYHIISCLCSCLFCSCYQVVSDSFVIPWAVAHQAPLSMGFSRQEYWGRLPRPPAGDLPDPGIEPGSPTVQEDFLPSGPPGKPYNPYLRITLFRIQINSVHLLTFRKQCICQCIVFSFRKVSTIAHKVKCKQAAQPRHCLCNLT